MNPSLTHPDRLFGRRRASAADAAWINGTAAHALDFDDVALRGHPSAVLVPAILAEGQALNAGGERMLAAWVIGYETWAELCGREADRLHIKGWHPTAIPTTIMHRRMNPLPNLNMRSSSTPRAPGVNT